MGRRTLLSRTNRKTLLNLGLVAAFLSVTLWSRELWAALPFIQHHPKLFLTSTLNLIQRRAYYANRVDWTAVRRNSVHILNTARTTDDVKPVIRRVLDELDDHHSTLTESFRLRTKLASLSVSTALQARALGNVTLIIVPGVRRDRQYDGSLYSNVLRELIVSGVHSSCGLILDLRGSNGGTAVPLLVGLAPLLGTGIVGGYRYRSGLTVPIVQVRGLVMQGLLPTGRLLSPDDARTGAGLPVAVLIGSDTASAGEVIAVVFKGRAHTRFFGEASYGASSSRLPVRLSDRSMLYLTDAVLTDRLGRVYGTAVQPDEVITKGTDPDEAVVRARAWLRTHERCS